MQTSSFSSVKAFIAAVGRDRFEAELGHSKQVVSRALAEGVMPAHWYFECRDWCSEIGVEVPEHLFRQTRKRPAAINKQNVNCRPAVQPRKTVNGKQRATV